MKTRPAKRHARGPKLIDALLQATIGLLFVTLVGLGVWTVQIRFDTDKSSQTMAGYERDIRALKTELDGLRDALAMAQQPDVLRRRAQEVGLELQPLSGRQIVRFVRRSHGPEWSEDVFLAESERSRPRPISTMGLIDPYRPGGGE